MAAESLRRASYDPIEIPQAARLDRLLHRTELGQRSLHLAEGLLAHVLARDPLCRAYAGVFADLFGAFVFV